MLWREHRGNQLSVASQLADPNRLQCGLPCRIPKALLIEHRHRAPGVGKAGRNHIGSNLWEIQIVHSDDSI